MRTLSKSVSGLVALLLVVALMIFALENRQPMRPQFLGQTFTANMWWVVVGAALLGALCSFVLLAPGRVTAGWRNRSLRREQTRRELDALRSEHVTRANWDQERTALTSENARLQSKQAASNSSQLSTTNAPPK